MAKKAKAGFDAGDKRAVEYVSGLFRSAKFEVQHELALGRKGDIDLVVGREDLGTYRKYAIVIALVRDAGDLVAKYEQLHNYAASKKTNEFDEFWLVSNLSTPERPRMRIPRHRNVRAFALKELERMLARENPKPRAAPKAGKAKTKIGKALEANEKEILLAVVGLMLQIDAKIEALRGERPNSDDAIAERDKHITEYERMRGELENIQTMVAAFKKGTEKEAKVVKSIKTFTEGVQSWWNKSHDAIITKTFDMGLFTTAVGICSMAGAGGKMSVAVSAVLVGGKPVAQALKGLIPKRFMGD